MKEDDYQTLAGLSEGLYKEKGSKFFAYAFSANDENDIKEHLEFVKKQHPKARHHCYAYRLGMDKHNFRANDDGEPSGTAGKPILGQIDSHGLTNTLIVVVRYFGGTKLGVPGLIHAYKQSSIDALAEAEIITKTVELNYQLSFEYDKMSDVMNGLKKCATNITKQEFTDKGYVNISIPKSEVDSSLLRLKAAIFKMSTNEAKGKEWGDIELLEL